MEKDPLSRIENVNPREYWTKEDAEFTPWLAEDENLALLSEAISIELELEDTEVRVGPFKADILCRELYTENLVLIENQLERTDHKHLGQILTYAAGLDASTIIWVSPKFVEEHISAIDWLNRSTSEDTNFFGIEVELLRIGNSPFAPRFNVVAKPDSWSKRIQSATRGGTNPAQTERANMYREFWSSLSEYMEKQNAPFNIQHVTGNHWVHCPLGIPTIRLILSYSFKNMRFKMFILFRPKDNVEWFDYVYENRARVESALTDDIDWFESEGDAVGYALITKDIQDNTPKEHNIVFEWIIKQARVIQQAANDLYGNYN